MLKENSSKEKYYNYNDSMLMDVIYTLINIDQRNSIAEKEEKNKWKEVNSIFKTIFEDNDTTINVVKLPTGSGKTANLIQWILYLCNKTGYLKTGGIDLIVILAPDYKNGINEIEMQIKKFDKFNTPYIILEGKYRTCKYNPKNSGINDINNEIDNGIGMGLPISSICNKDYGKCKDDCIFFSNMRNIKSEKGVKLVISTHHQLTRALPILIKNHSNILLLIDEKFENGIKTEFKIKSNTLRKNIEFLERIIFKRISYYTEKGKVITKNIEKKIKDQEYIGDMKYLRRLLILFERFIKDKIDYEKLDKLIEELYELKSILLLLSKEGWYEYKNNEIKPFKKFLFYQIENFIDNYTYQKRYKPENFNVWKENVIIREVHSETEEVSLSFKFFEQFKLNQIINSDKILKIINIDATANIGDLKILFNKNNNPYLKDDIIKEYYAPNLYSNKIQGFQLMQEVHNKKKSGFARFYKSTINNIRSFKNLKEDIKAVNDIFIDINNILFISREMKLRYYRRDLWEYLKEYVSSKLKCEPFGLASTNRYEDYQVAMTLGTPIISSKDNERESALLGRDPIERGEENARNTIKQAFGRVLRKTHDVFLFIIGGLELELDFPIKKIYKKQAWINGRLKWISAHKNWRNTMLELKKERNIEEIIDAPNTKYEIILDFLNKNNNRIELQDYMTLFGVSKRTASNHLKKFLIEKKLKFKLIGIKNKHVYFL